LDLSFCTFNLWNTERWSERQPAFTDFLRRHRPDVLVIQEVHRSHLEAIARTRSAYHFISDPFPGFMQEGNIVYNSDRLTMLEHGALDVGLSGYRRLFWALLREQDDDWLIATAHFTYQALQPERESGQSPRLDQARRTAAALTELLAQHGESALIFGADLNDFLNPVRLLREAGFEDVYSALGRSPLFTWPVPGMDHGAPEVDDWIFFRGARPLSIDRVEFYRNGVAPSDHFALLSVFRRD